MIWLYVKGFFVTVYEFVKAWITGDWGKAD